MWLYLSSGHFYRAKTFILRKLLSNLTNLLESYGSGVFVRQDGKRNDKWFPEGLNGVVAFTVNG